VQTLAIADLTMPKHMVRKLDPGHIKEVANSIQATGFSVIKADPGDEAQSPRSASVQLQLRESGRVRPPTLRAG
jgi:hypothetical protein